MGRGILSSIMSLSPQLLLGNASRERCIANLRELPTFVSGDTKSLAKASVLVPLCVVNGEVSILYTVRSANLKSHSGQISFPGGKTDGDETALETALRETEEEIGLSRADIDVWGQMPTIPGRNKDIMITPVVGEVKNLNIDNLTPNVHEVAEIFTVPMSAFCDPRNHGHLNYKPPLPLFIYGKHVVWGITGLITHLFLNCFLPSDVYKVDFTRKKFELHELMPAKL